MYKWKNKNYLHFKQGYFCRFHLKAYYKSKIFTFQFAYW